MYNSGELFNSISMLPAIPYAFYRAYNMKHMQFISPIAYAVMCKLSALHHLISHANGKPSMNWLKYDLVAQMVACIVTGVHTTYGVHGAMCITCLMLAHLKFINLNIKKHRYIAYGFNGISILLSTGDVSIVLHWIASFSLFGLGLLIPNRYTHTLFHVYNHVNMSMVWNSFALMQK